MIFSGDDDDADAMDRILRCNEDVFRAGVVNFMTDLTARIEHVFRAVVVLSLFCLFLAAMIVYVAWAD